MVDEGPFVSVLFHEPKGLAEGDGGEDVEGEELRYAGHIQDFFRLRVFLVEERDEVLRFDVDAGFEVVDAFAGVLSHHSQHLGHDTSRMDDTNPIPQLPPQRPMPSLIPLRKNIPGLPTHLKPTIPTSSPPHTPRQTHMSQQLKIIRYKKIRSNPRDVWYNPWLVGVLVDELFLGVVEVGGDALFEEPEVGDTS